MLTSKDNTELAALLEAAGRRDRAAFKALYDRVAPKLFAIALRILRDRGPAEDALQEIFLRIWQNAASFSPDAGSAMGWLTAIARNRAIDILRARRSAPLTAMSETTELWENIAAMDGGEAERLNLATLRRCLGAIEEPARSCVLLAYYEGYSREELARRFDKPVNTIKTWLFRSLTLLKSCLDSSS
jgi:RNA polymerase sigma factor (sigma-70 family)